MEQALWEACVAFHGHSCPGLAIGCRAAEVGLAALGLPLSPAQDEELVCITENDACGVDGVQVLTGCTMGKGNLLYRPTGKMAFSFFVRETNRGVRVVLNAHPAGLSRAQLQEWLLTAPAEEVFTIKQPHYALPEPARHFVDGVCARCGETTPEHKLHLHNGQTLCVDCYSAYTRGWEFACSE